MTKFFKRKIHDLAYNFLKVNMYGFPTRYQSEYLTLILIHLASSLLEGVGEGRVNRPTDRRIVKIFLPGFRNKSEILTDLRILQKQRIADSSIFGPRILDFACNKIFLPEFRIQGENLKADLVNKS